MPNESTQTELQKPSDHLMNLTARPRAVMVRGQGSYLWDASGRRYLDFVQGWAVNALGHAAPRAVGSHLASGCNAPEREPGVSHRSRERARRRPVLCEQDVSRLLLQLGS